MVSPRQCSRTPPTWSSTSLSHCHLYRVPVPVASNPNLIDRHHRLFLFLSLGMHSGVISRQRFSSSSLRVMNLYFIVSSTEHIVESPKGQCLKSVPPRHQLWSATRLSLCPSSQCHRPRGLRVTPTQAGKIIDVAFSYLSHTISLECGTVSPQGNI